MPNEAGVCVQSAARGKEKKDSLAEKHAKNLRFLQTQNGLWHVKTHIGLARKPRLPRQTILPPSLTLSWRRGFAFFPTNMPTPQQNQRTETKHVSAASRSMLRVGMSQKGCACHAMSTLPLFNAVLTIWCAKTTQLSEHIFNPTPKKTNHFFAAHAGNET